MTQLHRRQLLQGLAASTFAAVGTGHVAAAAPGTKAQIAITLDLEMSRKYPTRDMMEWDFQKGNLNEPTKNYSLAAARLTRDLGGLIHFFCVGRVLEQANIDWLKQIAEMGLAQEQEVTRCIHELVDLALSEKDHTSNRFLQWFVEEQLEEEATFSELLDVVRQSENLLLVEQYVFRQKPGVDMGGE